MKILITGGTGFIGSYLVPELLYEKHDVTCLTLDKSDHGNLKGLKGVNFVEGDVTDIDSLKEAVKGKDIIYHMVGVGELSANSEEAFKLFFKVNAKGTKNLLEAVRLYGKKNIKKIVCFSSTAAVGLKKVPVDETTKPNPVSPYQRSKFKGEEVAREYFKVYSLPVCIVRPSMVYGPRCMNSEIHRIARFIKKGIFVLFNDGSNGVPLIFVKDAVDGILSIGNNGKPGETYFLTGSKRYSMLELVKAVSRSMKKRPFIIKVPKIISYPSTFILEKLALVFRFKPVITIERIKSMTADRVFIVDKLLKIGFKPKDALQKDMDETIIWYKKNKLL